MPGELTEVTELATAIGTLPGDLAAHLTAAVPPVELTNVDPETWHRLTDAWRAGRHLGAFLAAHANGAALATAADGLRNRPPQRVEWRGPQRTPGDDTVPADLRIDHVYLVSCKYLSRVLLNAGPPRLFDRLLVGDERSGRNWFSTTAPQPFQALYRAAVDELNLPAMPDYVPAMPEHVPAMPEHVPAMPEHVGDLTRDQQRTLKESLPDRTLPPALIGPWADLCRAVAQESAARWASALASPRDQLRMLWRLLRIASVTYFVLGTQPTRRQRPPSVLRLRVDSAWDWSQAYELRSLTVSARPAGQPEVGWRAIIAGRHDGTEHEVLGHVEVRWSHGRFMGSPEAKVYLDTPHTRVPGYHPLV